MKARCDSWDSQVSKSTKASRGQSKLCLRFSTVLTVMLGVVTINGLRRCFGRLLDNAYGKDEISAGMRLLRTQVSATVHRMA
jgi:hypothetical protein